MEHKLHEVTNFKVLRPYTLEIQFDDGVRQEVNFQGVLEGELYGPLKDPKIFASVRLDRELGNLVWPNGADFDPEILHDWPQRKLAMIEAAQQWRKHTPGARQAMPAKSSRQSTLLNLGWYFGIGFCAGLVAKFVMHTHLGFIATFLVCILGSVGCGLLGDALASLDSQAQGGETNTRADSVALICALAGAIILLFAAGNIGI